jgi:acetoin utilization deacetylase AcuC-like enzyme
VLTIYAAVQRSHRPAYVVKQGEHSPSFDVPERIDSILSAISEEELGPVVVPGNVGLEPIRAVHDAGLIRYLAAAYERQNAEAESPTFVFPTFLPPPGQWRRPGGFEGQNLALYMIRGRTRIL